MMSLVAVLVVTAWEGLLDRVGTARTRLLVVGAAPWGLELLERLATSPKLRFDVIGLVDDERDGEQAAGIPVQARSPTLRTLSSGSSPTSS